MKTGLNSSVLRYGLILVLIVIAAGYYAVKSDWFDSGSGSINDVSDSTSHQAQSEISILGDQDSSEANNVPAPNATSNMVPKKTALDFSYINNREYLEEHWESELGCYGMDKDEYAWCDNPDLSAQSFEEAVWMLENGYPPATMLNELEALSDEQLLQMSQDTENSLAPLILSERLAARGEKIESYKRYMLSVFHNHRSAYTYQRRANMLMKYPDADALDQSYVGAAVNLKKAALLGDYRAREMLFALYNSYWEGNPGFITTDRITESAYLYLGRVFGLPKDQWPVTPRPKG